MKAGQRGRRVRRLLIALLVAVLGVAAGLAAGYAWVERAAVTPLDPASTDPIEVTIPKGATLHKIGADLAAQGLISSLLVWKIHLRLHPGHDPKAGRHKVTKAMSMAQLLDVLDGPPIPDELPLTIVEGWRLVDIDAHLAAIGRAAPGAFLALAKDPGRFRASFPLPQRDLEGYLYPETYMIPKEGPIDLEKLIQRQLDAFGEKFAVPHAAEITQSGRSLHELVVMASMLEREEPKPEVRPQVAGVLYKRLDAKTPLGVDATSRYTLADWNERRPFLAKLRDPEDPYNTSLKAGLPAGPIGAPSLPSLLAALRPVPSQYWYYLHDSEKNIHFAIDAAEHEGNRKRYNVW